MSRYKVMVDDNFHCENAEERWEQGIYGTAEEALAACRAIVDRSLEQQQRPGISAEALYDRYRSFGEDPFIVVLEGGDAGTTFSAWSRAKERCRILCGQP